MTTPAYDFERAQRYFQDRVAFTTGVHELEVLIGSPRAGAPFQVVDVRFPDDYAQGRVPGAINLPKGKWRNPAGLDRDATLYVYCYNQTCHLAAEAAVLLTAQGYRVVEVEGGWKGWVDNGYRQDTTPLAA
ncbi:rhodanese-like domain-containing protein [Vulcaniibacterium thermophilum]|uniref:Rhodanese n=1 Tax=Vulcaniibacterium thermophilum TaxID=1169913 RepID=A0A918Z517_9GAMM|nr:rhodanese-like domain-containing protein [Vulcaniibacterium thermophilum]GHE36385.1 rhodanese [Vulcaniibacterium thermophilum]